MRVLADAAPDNTPDTIHAHQHTMCSSNNDQAAGTDVSGSVSPARLWRSTRCVHHKRRLEGLCQRAGALITDVVAMEVQFGDGDVGLVLKQPWRINSQLVMEHL